MSRRILPWGLVLVSLTAAAQQDVVSRALHDEMQRSMQQLQMAQLEKPYFISYQVTDEDSIRAAATLGSAVTSSRNRVRVLSVSVRVGDYSLDNSGFLGGLQDIVSRSVAGIVALPLDEDYQELRRRIWLATDHAYKNALEDLAGKRAALEDSDKNGRVAAFYHASPAVVSDLAPPLAMDLEAATHLVREASALFKQAPKITGSEVQLLEVNRLRTYLNSEGTRFTIREPQIELRVRAEADAADGRPQSDLLTVFGRKAQDLPSAAALAPRIRAMQEELEQLAAAPLPARYEGPVLFEGEAAGELFATRFATNVAVEPAIVQGRGLQLPEGMSQQGSRLLRRIGFKVLPEFLDVADDPTLTQAAGSELMGSYKVDAEGVPARRTLVVGSGVLKTVLTSRAPVEGVQASTGNLRERGVAASNLVLSSQKSVTAQELRKQLIQLAQSQGAAYGIVIRRLHGNEADVAYRLYPDGREELLRNAQLEGLDVTALSRIVAVSSDSQVYTRLAPAPQLNGLRNALLNPGESFSGSEGPLLSCVVPSLLITGVTLDKPPGPAPKPALIPSPLVGR